MDRIDIGIDMWYRYWYRYRKICNNMQPYLSPGQRQAIIWSKAAILQIGPLGTNFNGILSKIGVFSFKKMHLKKLSAK